MFSGTISLLLILSDLPHCFTSVEDFRPVSGGQYSYEIQFTPEQQNMSALPIEIINDMSAEENETFVLSLTPGPDSALFNYEIQPSRSTTTVLIVDDDSQLFDQCMRIEHKCI